MDIDILLAVVFGISFLGLLLVIFGTRTRSNAGPNTDLADPMAGMDGFNSVENVQVPEVGRSPVNVDWSRPSQTPAFSILDSLLPLGKPILIVLLLSIWPAYAFLRMREVQKALGDPAKINVPQFNVQPMVNPNNFQFKFVTPPRVNIPSPPRISTQSIRR
jgi:hypothetical protein